MINSIPTDWKQVQLGSIADPEKKWSFTGGPFGSNLKSKDYTAEGVRIIQLQNIGDGKFNDDYKIYTSKTKADELLSCNIYPGEIILSKMGDPVGRACIIPDSEDRFLMASDGIRVVPDSGAYNTFFIFSAINSGYFRIKVESSSTGSTRKRIGLSVLRKIKVLCPPLPEQHRIVSVLGTWDKMIEKLSRKIELKKNIKKGLMQELLTGKKRLKGFGGEWHTVKLGGLGIFSKGAGIPKVDLSKDGHNAVRYGELYTKHDFQIKKIYSFISDKIISTTTPIKHGDILFAGSGETIDEIGKSAAYLLNAPCYAGGDTIIFSSKKVDSLFLAFLLNIGTSRRLLRTFGQGQSVVHIYKKDLEKLQIYIPCDTKEQNAIAHIITIADNEITALEKKKQILEDQKKYLLNNLITGQIRTPENLTMNNHAS